MRQFSANDSSKYLSRFELVTERQHIAVPLPQNYSRTSAHKKHLYACPGISVTTGMMELTSSSEPASEYPKYLLGRHQTRQFYLWGFLPDQIKILNKNYQIWSHIKLDLKQDPAKNLEACCTARSNNKQHSLAVASISNIQNQIFSRCANIWQMLPAFWHVFEENIQLLVVNFMSQIADLGKGWKRKSHKRTWTWAWLGLCGWQSLSDYSRLIAVTVHRTDNSLDLQSSETFHVRCKHALLVPVGKTLGRSWKH